MLPNVLSAWDGPTAKIIGLRCPLQELGTSGLGLGRTAPGCPSPMPRPRAPPRHMENEWWWKEGRGGGPETGLRAGEKLVTHLPRYLQKGPGGLPAVGRTSLVGFPALWQGGLGLEDASRPAGSSAQVSLLGHLLLPQVISRSGSGLWTALRRDASRQEHTVPSAGPQCDCFPVVQAETPHSGQD